MNTIISFFRDYVAWLTIPDFTITDVLEIAIIAFGLLSHYFVDKRYESMGFAKRYGDS